MVTITSHLRCCLIQRVSDLLLLHKLLGMLTRYSHRYPCAIHHCWMACGTTCCPRGLEIDGWCPSCQLSWSLQYAWTPHRALTISQPSPRHNCAGAFHADSLVHQSKEEGRSAYACLWHICCWYLLYTGAHTPSESWSCHSEEAQVPQIWPNDTQHQPQKIQGFCCSGIYSLLKYEVSVLTDIF